MFPQSQRLTEKRVFDTIFRRGKWVRGKAFSLIYLPTQQSTRLGFIVTKKTAKSAVTRNLIKRRVRATFLTSLKQPELSSLLDHFYIVVVIHPGAIKQSYANLLKEAVAHLNQLKQASMKS